MALIRRSTHLALASPAAVATAAACLRRGGLVAMPTETVYGLAADATSDKAVAGVFAAKGRPSFNPLIAHVLDVEQAKRFAAIFEASRESRRGVLARTAHACAARRTRLRSEPSGARRGRHGRAARAGARNCPSLDRGRRGAACRSFRQSLRPGQSDHGRARPCRSRRQDRLDSRRRRLPLRARIDDRCLSRCRARAPSSGRDRSRRDRGPDRGAAGAGAVGESADCAGASKVTLRASRPSPSRSLGRGDHRSRPRLWRRIVRTPLDGATRPFAVWGPGRGGLEPVRVFARFGRKRRLDHRGRSGSRSRSRSGNQ